MQTDRHMDANRTDIIITDKVKSTCKLIDMTVLCGKNVSSKEIEMKSKLEIIKLRCNEVGKLKQK